MLYEIVQAGYEMPNLTDTLFEITVCERQFTIEGARKRLQKIVIIVERAREGSGIIMSARFHHA
jgi:hypothetical protein